jgi:hypothetical protein
MVFVPLINSSLCNTKRYKVIKRFFTLFAFPIFRRMLSVPDEDYSRKASCALNLISTFYCVIQIILSVFIRTRTREVTIGINISSCNLFPNPIKIIFIRYAQHRKIGKANNVKVFVAIKPKSLNSITYSCDNCCVW